MDLRLAGKRALVTGSSAGLGEAIAKLLAAEGVGIVVHGRDEGRTNAVAEAIRADGGRADVALGDLSTDAGAYHHQTWMEATPARWIETYESNVLSGVRMIHRLLPQMRERRWGRVIQIGGGLAIQPVPTTPDYAASLAARHNLAVSLARELKDSGVTSNVVAPGAILVASVEKLLVEVAPRYGWGERWEEIERGCVRDMIPNDVGRLGRPEEIAAAVAYLASPLTDYVSGAVLRVDGGTIRSVH